MEVHLNILTSQIAYEVVKSHFTLGFDVGRVHISVEENHGEGQDKNGVWVVKLLHHVRITHTVSLAVEGENVDHQLAEQKKSSLVRQTNKTINK